MPSRGSGGLSKLRPQGRGCCSACGSFTGDSNLVAADALKQAAQEVLGQVVAPIDASVVPNELLAVHLLFDLQALHLRPSRIQRWLSVSMPDYPPPHLFDKKVNFSQETAIQKVASKALRCKLLDFFH